jgi:hypothetical protein
MYSLTGNLSWRYLSQTIHLNSRTYPKLCARVVMVAVALYNSYESW